MDTLTLSSVMLLKVTRTPIEGVLTCSASFTKSAIAAMGWQDLPECATATDLDGDLAATSLVITPKDKELERHAIELSVSRVCNFSTVRLELEGKQGKGHRTELRLKIHFPDVKGACKIEQYMLTCGKSTLRVSYERQAAQVGIEGVADAQGRLISEAQADATDESED